VPKASDIEAWSKCTPWDENGLFISVVWDQLDIISVSIVKQRLEM